MPGRSPWQKETCRRIVEHDFERGQTLADKFTHPVAASRIAAAGQFQDVTDHL